MGRRRYIPSGLAAFVAAVAACGGGAGTPDADVPDAHAAPDAAAPAAVRLLAFNDFHGALTPPTQSPGLGGAAHLAATIDALRTDHTLVVSAGDLIGGSPLESALFHDEPTIDVMNAIGLDYTAVGNHELDEGAAELLRMQHGGCHPVDGCSPIGTFGGADFPFLAANTEIEATGAPILPGYALREIDGVTVAIVGMTLEATRGETLSEAIPELTFGDEVETMTTLAPQLEAEGADVIVLLLHEGATQAGGADACVNLVGPLVGIAEGLAGVVPVIVSGHSHAAFVCDVDGVTVTAAGARGIFVTSIDLVIDRAGGGVVDVVADNHEVTDAASDAEVAAVVAAYDEVVAPVRDAVIGTITADIPSASSVAGESPAGSVVADAMLAATAAPAVAAADLALMNRGGIRASFLHARGGAETADGQVTYGEAFAVQPFGNQVRTVTLAGADLVAALDQWSASGPLQVAGMTYTWHASAAPGARVTAADVLVGGVAVDPEASYRVTVNSIVGDPWNTPVMANATEPVAAGVDLALLEAYFAAASPVGPPPAGRITRAP